MVDVLLPEHKAMLAASAIAEYVIAERGYRSVNVKAELKRLGFADAQCGVPTLLVPIFGVAGEIVNYHHRPDQPRVNPKTGKANKYEFPKSSRMALDVHPRIRLPIRDPKIPLFITEGVKKADAAISIGLCCIGVIGTWNWRGTNEFGGKTALPDWESIALKGQRDEPRQVYICYDSDVMVKPQVYGALSRLSEFLKMRGANVAFIYLPHGEDGSKVGLDDYLAAGHDVNDLMSLASTELRPAPKPDAGGDDDQDGATVAQKIVALAGGVEFFYSERGDAYGRMTVNDHLQTHPVRSSAFKQWISREYYTAYDKPASSQAIEDAMRVFEAKSRFEGVERTMNLRCARHEDGSIYIDMVDKSWRAIRITATGWQIESDPPALFRRHVTQAAMCEPDGRATSGDIDLLKQFTNVRTDAAWRLLVVWLAAAWVPEIAHPVLMVYGEQGTAKSTLMRLLSLLIDPSQTPLRTEPKDEPAWMQAADHTWLLTLDNVSLLSNWLSDSICRAVTGAGSVKRQLYTDADDIVMAFRRVIAVTSIEVVARRGDLLDRSILLGLEPIQSDKRRSEKRVIEEFERVRSRLVGALLSILSGVMRVLPMIEEQTVGRPDLPRMADFANVGIAVERILDWPVGSFMSAYLEGIGEQNEEALASAIIYRPLMQHLEEQPEWTGSAQELLDRLNKITEDKLSRVSDWPKNAKALSGHLRRAAPSLRAIGVDVVFGKRGRFRPITITRRRMDSCVDRVETTAGAPIEPDSSGSCDECDANDANSPTLSYGADNDDTEDDDDFDRALEAIRR